MKAAAFTNKDAIYWFSTPFLNLNCGGLETQASAGPSKPTAGKPSLGVTDVNADLQNIEHLHPIHQVIVEGDYGRFKFLVDSNTSLVNQCVSGGKQWSPLFYAVDYNRIDMINYLIEKGANVNYMASDGKSLFHLAVKNNSRYAIIAVSKAGGDINVVSRDGQTPLLLAAVHGSFELASLLICMGANVNFQDRLGKTALHYTCAFGHLDFFKALLGCHAKTNIKDFTFRTPLDYANQFKHTQLVGLLLQHKAALSESEEEDETTSLGSEMDREGSLDTNSLFGAMLLPVATDTTDQHQVPPWQLPVILSPQKAGHPKPRRRPDSLATSITQSTKISKIPSTSLGRHNSKISISSDNLSMTGLSSTFQKMSSTPVEPLVPRQSQHLFKSAHAAHHHHAGSAAAGAGVAGISNNPAHMGRGPQFVNELAVTLNKRLAKESDQKDNQLRIVTQQLLDSDKKNIGLQFQIGEIADALDRLYDGESISKDEALMQIRKAIDKDIGGCKNDVVATQKIEHQNKIRELMHTQDLLRSNNEKLTLEKNELRAQLQSMDEKNRELRLELDNLNVEVSDLQSSIRVMHHASDGQEQIEDYEIRLQQVNQQLKVKNSMISNMRAELADANKTVEQQAAEIEALSQKNAELAWSKEPHHKNQGTVSEEIPHDQIFKEQGEEQAEQLSRIEDLEVIASALKQALVESTDRFHEMIQERNLLSEKYAKELSRGLALEKSLAAVQTGHVSEKAD